MNPVVMKRIIVMANDMLVKAPEKEEQVLSMLLGEKKNPKNINQIYHIAKMSNCTTLVKLLDKYKDLKDKK